MDNSYLRSAKQPANIVTVELLLDSVEKARNFARDVGKLNGDYDLEQGHNYIDAKSFMGIFTLDLKRPMKLHVRKDDAQALEKLNRYIWRRAV